MHTVHHSAAIILKSVPTGEANRLVSLFTRDFGRIVATVQGVRKQGAKLQMQLREYTFVSVDLVKGKDMWRLVSVAESYNPLRNVLYSDLARSFVRTLAAIERFCHGEERNDELFDHLEACAHCVADGTHDAVTLDTVSIWRVLVILGYSAVEKKDEPLYTMPFRDALADMTIQTRSRLIRRVNKVITHTHL